MVSFLSGALWAVKGLWKLELATALGSLDCSRRCEFGDEAVVAEAAARREDEDGEVGRGCRVQLRRAAPAEVEAGRIVRSGEQRGLLFEEVEARN